MWTEEDTSGGNCVRFVTYHQKSFSDRQSQFMWNNCDMWYMVNNKFITYFAQITSAYRFSPLSENKGKCNYSKGGTSSLLF